MPLRLFPITTVLIIHHPAFANHPFNFQNYQNIKKLPSHLRRGDSQQNMVPPERYDVSQIWKTLNHFMSRTISKKSLASPRGGKFRRRHFARALQPRYATGKRRGRPSFALIPTSTSRKQRSETARPRHFCLWLPNQKQKSTCYISKLSLPKRITSSPGLHRKSTESR